MAKYDYKCRECEHVQVTYHGVQEDPEVVCENCGGVDTFKYMGNYKTMTVNFKGPGFAINDAAYDKIGMPEHMKTGEAREYLDKL